MNKGIIYFLIAVVAIVVIAGGAFLASVYYQGGSGEASEPISAPELSLDEESTESETAAEDESSAEDTAEVESTEEATEEPAIEVEPTEEATEEPTAEPTEAPTEEPAAVRRLYRIVQEESQARFELDEDLFDAPKHVVGTTDQVAGDVIVDFGTPANSELGVIRVNARTLETDNEFRNRALRSRILESAEDEYEYIDFMPATLEGLPESVAVGDTVEFQIVGDLKIRDVTQTVTFSATVTIAAEDRLEGQAQVEVLREDFGLTIPDVPNVANVTDEVLLTIEFVALEVAE